MPVQLHCHDRQRCHSQLFVPCLLRSSSLPSTLPVHSLPRTSASHPTTPITLNIGPSRPYPHQAPTTLKIDATTGCHGIKGLVPICPLDITISSIVVSLSTALTSPVTRPVTRAPLPLGRALGKALGDQQPGIGRSIGKSMEYSRNTPLQLGELKGPKATALQLLLSFPAVNFASAFSKSLELSGELVCSLEKLVFR